MQKDSSGVNSSRWNAIQTKARSKDVKERERTEKQTASAKRQAEKRRIIQKNYIFIAIKTPSESTDYCCQLYEALASRPTCMYARIH